jgi:hypothetical protein
MLYLAAIIQTPNERSTSSRRDRREMRIRKLSGPKRRRGTLWRTKDEYASLLCVVLRTCTVAVKDLRDIEHSIEVTAETLYEAIATALAALQQDNWVGEIGQGFTAVTVVVQQPPVKHEVKMKDFVSWLGRQGRSPAEVILKQKLEKILGKVVARGRDRKE